MIPLQAYAKGIDEIFIQDATPNEAFTEFRRDLVGLAADSKQAFESLAPLRRAQEDLKSGRAINEESDPFSSANDPFLGDAFSLRNFEKQEKAQDRADALEEQTKARIHRSMKLKQAQADQEEALNKQRNQDLISFYSQNLSIIENGLGESNILAKVAFAANQAISIANIISSTEQAAMAAYAAGGPYAGPALSGAARAVGYASAGIVAGQTLASFDGGGFTGSGSRTGGVDGKGGFTAVLHPWETVIDHTKGQSAGGKVEVHNYTGQGVQTLTRGDVTQIIIGEMGNQNSQSRRALTQTSNVQGRGLR